MSDGPVAFDPVLHSGPRITVMSRMVIHRVMRFSALQRSTGLTSGNLATHLAVLEGAGYLAIATEERAVSRRKTVSITDAGDWAYRAYVAALRAFVHQAEGALTGGSSDVGDKSRRTNV